MTRWDPPAISNNAPADGAAKPPRTNTPPRGQDPKAAPKAPAKAPAFTGPAVFGDDPRVVGNELPDRRDPDVRRRDGRAEFLTAGGVPSVVVVPENVKATPSEHQIDPRASWQIIVREGFTRDEFRAASARADAIEKAVRQIGRRWKDDQKGSTNFSRCFWKKFGK